MASRIVSRAIAIASALGALLGIAGRGGAAAEAEGGFLNRPLAEVQKTDFFTWFHLGETGREAAGNGEQTITFQPTGEKFHALAIVTVSVDSQLKIQRIDLVLKRSFINSPSNGIFAADVAKSFVSNVPPRTDAEQMNTLVDEIQYRARSSQTIIVGPGYKPSKLPDPPSPAYQTYAGDRAADSKKLAHCIFEIDNEQASDADQVRMSFAPK